MRFFTKFFTQLACAVGLLSSFVAPLILKAVVGASNDLVIIYEYGKNEFSSLSLNQSFSNPDRPEGIGAAANTLLTALYQKVPVLVPLPLWQIIIEHKNLFEKIIKAPNAESVYKNLKNYKLFNTQEACTSLYKRFSYINKLYEKLCTHIALAQNPEELKQALYSDTLFDKSQCPGDLRYTTDFAWFELSHYLLCSHIPLNDFIVKQVALKTHPNHAFLLFLPRDYYKDTGKTGLALEKYKTVPDAYALKLPILAQHELGQYDTVFIDVLRDLFISKNNMTNKAIRWNIYCMGHGIYSENAHESIEREKRSLRTQQNRLKKLESQAAHPFSYSQEIKEQKKAITNHKKRINSLNKNNQVCGMPLKIFTNFLLFLEEEISTALLYYSSCSSGGKHFIDTFTLDPEPSTQANRQANTQAKTQENNQLTVSYVVLADTLAEAPSSSANPILHLGYIIDRSAKQEYPLEFVDLINWDAKNRAITKNNTPTKNTGSIQQRITPFLVDTLYYFSDFFTCARTTQPTLEGVKKLIASLSPVHQRIDAASCFKDKNPERLENCSVSYEVVNFPSIRLPGQSRFFCVDDEGVSLIACAAQKPESAALSINEKTQALLLYTPEIEKIIYTPAVTNKTEMGYASKRESSEIFPAMVSMIPGKAYHTIDEIYAPTVTLSTLVKQNFPFFKLYAPKLVHIKKLTCINDCPAVKSTDTSNKQGKQPQVQVFYDVLLANRDKSTSNNHKIGRNKLFFTLSPDAINNNKKRRWYGTSWSANQEIPKNIIKKVNTIPQGEQQATKLKNYFADANTLDDYRAHRSITSSEITRALCAPLDTAKAVKDIFKSFIPKS